MAKSYLFVKMPAVQYQLCLPRPKLERTEMNLVHFATARPEIRAGGGRGGWLPNREIKT